MTTTAEHTQQPREDQAAAGLLSALTSALTALDHARRHYGVLIDELFVPGYTDTADGSDLGDHLDAASQQLRATVRAAALIESSNREGIRHG